MHVQVGYVLVGGFSVLLDYADSVSVCGFFDGYGYLLGDSVNVRVKLLWNIENVLVMRLRYDECVSLIQRSYVKERQDFFVFVNAVGRYLFLRDSAKDA